ncbi:MAG: hypothetical protein IJT32_07680 [Lachnospiraceae bacterium]|nr:hypothetical protein [Lachnospiraceae bacterium]
MISITISGEYDEEKVIRSCKTHTDMTFFYPGERGFSIDGTSGQLHGDFDILKRILSERAGHTRVTLVTDDGRLYLAFPSYLYDFIEDTRARAIHHKIEGSGYVYRECVWRRSIRLREYDGLFSHAVDEGGTAAFDVALGRLLSPVDLAVGHREKYERYIERCAFAVLCYILNLDIANDGASDRTADPYPWQPIQALSLMTERMLIDRETVDAILPGCNTPSLSEAAAMLLAYEKKHWGKQRAQAMVPDML